LLAFEGCGPDEENSLVYLFLFTVVYKP
jgi:hypothetical protein